MASASVPAAGTKAGSVNFIVTCYPDRFESYFRDRIGVTIHVFDDCDAALQGLRRIQVDRLFADFHEIQHGCSGTTLLERIRLVPALADLQVWLMAARWPAGLSAWVEKAGGSGMVQLHPRAIRVHLAEHEPWAGLVPRVESDLRRVEAIFRRNTGPLGCMHTDAGRAAIARGELEARPDALAGFLGQCSDRRRRAPFLAAVRADPALSKWFDLDSKRATTSGVMTPAARLAHTMANIKRP